MPTEITFIRHGETAWSLSGQHTGVTDLPLTHDGEAQVRHLAPLLAGRHFEHVICSPRLRARRTCELIGLPGDIAVEIDPDLAEWNYGDHEGRRGSEIRADHADWDIFRHGAPNGEAAHEIAARADRVIARLRALDASIAMFSHGHFGSCLAARWIGLPIERARHFRLATASMSVLGSDPSHPEVPVILNWNVLPTAGNVLPTAA